ncbi:MAG TPA: hypothetical protein VMU45_01665 [Candidatus Eisenbacteria bacterium]|nr:hypothetical protein [Candidatus Eisenbacteria bacterium]
MHTGFPFSRLDQNWNYLGPENQAGRFPTILALDTKLQYQVDFTFHGHLIQFRFGLTVYNVLNHNNPRDVQQYFASPDYGVFYNSVPRLWRIDGDFDFWRVVPRALLAPRNYKPAPADGTRSLNPLATRETAYDLQSNKPIILSVTFLPSRRFILVSALCGEPGEGAEQRGGRAASG